MAFRYYETVSSENVGERYRKEDIQTHEYSLRWLERRLVADMIRQNLNGPISTYQADSLAKSIGKYMDDVYYWLETVYLLTCDFRLYSL